MSGGFGSLPSFASGDDQGAVSPALQAWIQDQRLQAQYEPQATAPGFTGYVAPTAPAAADPSKVLTPLGQKWAGDLKDVVTAPQRAYTGELQVWDPATGHTTDAAQNAAMGIAGLAMTGSAPVPAPAGALRVFGGRSAATADQAALSRAEQMAGLGSDRQTIWDRTGWFKGADQKWRFEIPDNAATVGPQGLQHSDLQAAYPGMWDKTQQSVVSSPQTTGYFHPEQNVVVARGPTTAEQRSAALHEYQHAIQAQEGFAPGTELVNPVSRADPGVRAALRAKNDALMSGDPTAIAQATQAHKQSLYDIYAAHAGEVEARNVQARRDFTPEQRRAVPPWKTQDTPDAAQIVQLLNQIQGR